MANPRLTESERMKADSLVREIEKRIHLLSKGVQRRKFAYRRRVTRLLIQIEKGTPAQRGKLRAKLREKQHDLCAVTPTHRLKSEVELHRLDAIRGYTIKNTRLVCRACHRKFHASHKFSL